MTVSAENGFKRFETAAEQLIFNALTSRIETFRRRIDPRRDIDNECGYPKTMSPEDYKTLHDRNPIAARAVELFPRECWQVQPMVYEDEDAETETPFETAVKGLADSLRVKSKFRGNQGNPIWQALTRIDRLSGIGRYGVLLLGIDDGEKDLTQPAKPRPGRKLLQIRAFPEALAQITRFVDDPSDPRNGLPEIYKLTFNDPQDAWSGMSIGLTTNQKDVHWTRVVHVPCENIGTNEAFGTPRLFQTYRNCLNIEKIYAASGEGYWQNAFSGLAFESHPALGGDVNVDMASLKNMFENYQMGIQKYLVGVGGSFKPLAPTVVDPTPHLMAQIQLICVRMGCPQRVFMGSERGELASSQDDSAWNDRLSQRNNDHTTPNVVAPFFDACIRLGILPEPEQYGIAWPPMESETDGTRADTLVKKTNAMSAYISGGVDSLMPPKEYLTRFMDMEPEEAESILEAVEEHKQELQEADLEAQQAQIDAGLANPPQPPSGPSPIKVKEGETLMDPTTGKPVGELPTEGEPVENKFNKNQPRKEDGEFAKVGQASKKKTKKPTHSEIAKKTHVLVDKDIQRYAEEHNEPAFAKAVRGRSHPNSEPVDVTTHRKDGTPVHGIEMKTSVVGGNRTIDMNPFAKVRKINWEKETGATFHTVVFDDHDVYNAKGPGEHDVSKRRYFYRRGVGGSKFSIDGMHEAKSIAELKRLMDMDESELPAKAQRTDQELRKGTWKPFQDAIGNGFSNVETGAVVRAKTKKKAKV